MNLRDLEYFVAVADQRHFGRAAEACHVSQPTLSMQIKKLESELGVELLERNPRGVTLTAAGDRILERARLVLREADDIVGLAREMSDPATASLRIGLFPTLGPYLLPHVVPGIHRAFPRLELLLAEAKTEEIADQLDRGELDAGVLALPIDDQSLEHTVLFEEDFVLAVPADHELAGSRGPVPIWALADQSVLLLEDGHCLREQALDVCHLAGARERAGFRSTSLETMRQMVAAGVGITLLPRLAVSSPVAESDSIALIEFEEPVPSRTIAMFWSGGSAYREFLPELAAAMQQLPPGLVRISDPPPAATS
jgi:LysR family hydrogen peroxide-inducible transcriptional activator